MVGQIQLQFFMDDFLFSFQLGQETVSKTVVESTELDCISSFEFQQKLIVAIVDGGELERNHRCRFFSYAVVDGFVQSRALPQ